MKQMVCLLVVLLSGVAAYAQDVDFGAFDEPAPMLAPAAPRGAPAARGAVAPPPPPDRLVRLRETLAKADAALTKEQETELNKLLETEIPMMRRTIQTHGQKMMAERAASAPPAGAPAAPSPAAPPPTPPASVAAPGRGAPPAAGGPSAALLAAALAARGAAPSSRVPAEILDALEVEMRQLNDGLFAKVASSPTLNPNQQSVLTKMARAQIRSRGGYDALRIAMEDAGTPFTTEQVPKVQALFEQQKTARATLAKESQGTPDPAKLRQLERETLTTVVGLLVPAQRTALLAMLREQR